MTLSDTTRRHLEIALCDAADALALCKLADALNRAIDGRDEDRAAIVARMAEAGGIDEGTVGGILNGRITRPPDERLRGFARVLGLSFESLRRMAEEDAASAAVETATALCFEISREAPDEVQLMPAGEVRTRSNDSRPAWQNPDSAAVVAASRAIGRDLAIDYEHQTDYAAKNGQPAPAAGWIKSLEARAQGIFGHVEWTAKARAMIEGGEYRFISPTFDYTRETREVRRIQRAALTNNPALFLTAIARAEDSPLEELLKRLRQILGLDDTADDKAIATATQALVDKQKDGQASTAAAESLAKIAKALGLEETAEASAIETAAASAATQATKPDPAKFVPIDDFNKVVGRVGSLESDRATDSATAAVDQAIKDGRLFPAQRDWAIGYAKSDLAAFNAFTAKQPKMDLAGTTVVPEDSGGGAISPTELAFCKAMGIDPKDYQKTGEIIREEARP